MNPTVVKPTTSRTKVQQTAKPIASKIRSWIDSASLNLPDLPKPVAEKKTTVRPRQAAQPDAIEELRASRIKRPRLTWD